jgi:integrase
VRAHVALGIYGFQGARQNAVLHLKWSDVDEDAGEITWRSEWDKRGNEWTQALRGPTRVLLAIAHVHHERMQLSSEWIFPAGSAKSTREVYSGKSLWRALKGAPIRSGVANPRAARCARSEASPGWRSKRIDG